MIVALTAYNRPDYLREVMDSIEVARRRLSPEPLFIVARVEPSPVQATLAEIIGSGRGTYVTVNDELYGHVANIRAAWEDGWAVAERFGEDFVMHLPDDILVAPDAFECAAFMRDAFRDDPQAIATSLFSRAEPQPDRWRLVAPITGWSSQGAGTWAKEWPRLTAVWEPHIEKKQRGNDPEGYRGIDRCIHEDLLYKGSRFFQVAPILSRCKHIGLENGVHTTPETFLGDSPTVWAADVEPEGPWALA